MSKYVVIFSTGCLLHVVQLSKDSEYKTLCKACMNYNTVLILFLPFKNFIAMADLTLCVLLFCRYNVRGLDSDGHAANFVETEQIIEYDYTKCSFVQVILVHSVIFQTFSLCSCIKYKHLFIVTMSSIFRNCNLHQCPKKNLSSRYKNHHIDQF